MCAAIGAAWWGAPVARWGAHRSRAGRAPVARIASGGVAHRWGAPDPRSGAASGVWRVRFIYCLFLRINYRIYFYVVPIDSFSIRNIVCASTISQW